MNYLTNKRMRNGIATRRQLLLALGAGALGTARLASAQQPAPQPSLPRIVFISPIGAAQSATRIGAFKDGLRINGLVEGRHYVVDVLYAEGQFERFPALVQQALQRGPAVFVLVAPASVRAAQAATKTIPIVFVTAADPVGAGLVASLARPGGNTTGVIGQADELALKHVELLHEALPRARRIAVLSAADTAHAKVFDRVSAVATGFGMSARRFEAGSPAVLDAALEAIAQHRPDALLILTYAPFFGERDRIAAAMLKARIPVFAPEAEFVDAGCLMSYAPPYTEMFRYAALHVKKILAGTKPADLPVEQPTRFEMAVNLKTAEALGIKIPHSLLVRAERVIE